MAKKKTVAARKLVDFADVVGERHLIQVTVSASLEPVILSLEQVPDYRIEKDHASFSKNMADVANSFRIHRLVNNEWLSLDLPPTVENYYFVQPLGKAQWLLVRARADDEQDKNAHVYGSGGKHVRSFHAGDGIEDVQVTERGTVWISYFDEGVFGNTDLGRSGLAAINRRGQPIFRFTDLSSDRVVQSMADCYALNVCSDREVWLYYYTDFPVAKLLDRKLAKFWFVPIKGSHAFAIDGTHVLLGGSYDKRDHLFLVDLDTLAFEKLMPTYHDGEPLKQFRAFGRRHHLFIETATSLHVVNMRDLNH